MYYVYSLMRLNKIISFSLYSILTPPFFFFFFFNDTATTEIYTLSLHDALPICHALDSGPDSGGGGHAVLQRFDEIEIERDRKSTRLNSSHSQISYAVFCLKKKKKKHNIYLQSYIADQQRAIPIRYSRHRVHPPL